MKINWESFKVYVQDARGIQYKFEDLCRQLFIKENLYGNKQFRYLHANPNNAGLETEPIYDETNKRWIGFQVKYFDNKVDYNQIMHSVKKIVEFYTGKLGKVDLVYLFSNKPITSKSCVDIIKTLEDSNIKLQLITDTTILDLVRNNYPCLGLCYFGNHSIGHDWFINHTKKMYDLLGERYNQDFNVETEFSYELSLFLHDRYARDIINNKKKNLINKIKKIYTRYDSEKTYLKILKDTVTVLPDVNIETLIDSLEWQNKVACAVGSYLEMLIEERSKLEEKKNEFYALAFDSSENGNSRASAKNKYYETKNRINQINTLLDLPNIISFSEREKKLLYGDIMLVSGKAGTGKSHLLSYKTNMLLNENRMALLLLGGIYYINSPICEQIMSNLGLKYSFEELIDILETIGERDNCIIPIFIDALNETWNHKLWKNDLQDIIEIITHRRMVKLVVSYRQEYEVVLLSDSVLKKKNNGQLVNLVHTGFEENSVSAVRNFLNHYNIPFSPLEYFGVEMSNPLFLTLYCKTYNGEDVSLPKLYERIIEKVSEKIFTILDLQSKGFFEGDNILNPFIEQISERMVINKCRFISRADLIKLTFWTEYGINVAPFIGQLVKEGLLYNFINDNIEYYYFAYDQMNDYYFAKAIMRMCYDKKDVQDFLANKILNIKDGKLNNLGDIDIFVDVCALYAEKYGEECIDIIDSLVEKHDQRIIFSRYINSLQWRNSDYINKSLIYDLLRKYPLEIDDLWSMLIGNSVKVRHPLNANFLHEFLSDYELNKRDYLWTTYINELPSQDENRVIQLIKMYDCGDKLENVNQEQIELLLILFGWMLTSSNRWLRDYASKAMIEILKDHFQFCNVILEKFNYVDDPYVVQRLYGVVFGACCKRKSGSLETLAEYVYENIFNQEKVYPDILLRDYARLIVEKFLFETPNYNGIIVREKISPPYNSEPIPDIEDQHYENKEYDGAIFRIVMSMRIEKMGGYGDFGRYIFQSALHSFDVDEKKMFNYAVYYILNELGFNEKFFDIHDGYCVYYDRHTTVKKERIGKKYQWITLYNMLARISDHYKMVDQWSYPSKKEVFFEGAWDPYVRDFDPTLNVSFMVCNDAPIFKILEEHVAKGKAENNSFDISNEAVQKVWLEEKGIFLSDIKSTLILTDANDEKWICLTKYCGTGRENLNIERLCVWSWLYAYFVTPKQQKAFSKCAEKGLSVINQKVASHHEIYSVFNREYPWSPSCREFDEYAWVDACIKTGEVEIVKQTVPFPDISLIREYDEELDKEIDLDILHESDNLCRQVIREQEIKKEIGKILHATTNLIWEEEYDATKESTISRSFPCATLIELMGLRQLVSDGFFYDTQGKLAAFDTALTQNVNSVVVRKDILDEFLIKTGMKLIWLVDAEKEIHTDDYSTVKWSDWEAVFSYNGDNIDGEIHRIQ